MTIRSVSIPVSRPFAITPWLPFRLDERERGGCRPSTGSSRRARAVAVVFSLDQHGPDDARGFGGERHHGDLVGSPREQIAQPWIGDAARLLLPQMSAGSADQQRPQHAISLFGDAPGTMLATGAMVFTSEPNPGREVATGAEHLRIGHFGQDRAGDEDFERCYRAVQSKDARFDGWFVTAVLTTRIYCRPSCPVRPPFARNVRFYPTAAAAPRAGFRACKRCRPDASPGSPEWDVRGDVVARAMRLIADGTVDREGVAGLAGHLGYTTRQVERLLQAEVGAGPLALARAQRTQTARVLIETTEVPFGDVAFASGFSSIRQFNDSVNLVFEST